MNENPEGTPNPLNPAPGTGEELAAGTGPLDFVETANVSEIMEEPVEEPVKEPEPAEEPAPEPEPVSEPEKAPEPIKPASFTEAAGSMEVFEEAEPSEPAEPASHDVADPMMRPVSHNNFDTLGMDNATNEPPVEEVSLKETVISRATPVAAPINNTPELVAKDSIVEPAGGGSKKKILAIGAIVLLIIAIICGAAAAAIMFVGKNSDDRVAKAIDRLLNGETSSIIAVQGNLDAIPNTDDSSIGDFGLDFNGTFDMRSGMNTVSAKINAEIAGGVKASISVDELKNEDGDVFLKVRGLNSLFDGTITTDSEDVTKLTNCINDTSTTNCVSATGSTTASDLVSFYGGLIEVIDNQWIMASDDFGDAMGDLGLFDNSSACLVKAFGTLPQYGKDIAKKYEANPFIISSTDNLEISKKKNELYKISFDNDKLAAFINSLSNNGFMNELNACTGDIATNSEVDANIIANTFVNFPAIYAEVDDEYNFTRVYFKGNTADTLVEDSCQCITAPCDCPTYGSPSMTITADLALSYPNKLEITEPDDYIEMSNLVNKLVTNLFSVTAN